MTPIRFLAGLAIAGCLAGPALAERIKNPTAVFNGLDKITGRLISFDVAIGETVQFGALQVTPRACYSRPSDEQPKTTTFVEVDEVMLDGQQKRLFSGWMFAESPGLNAVEHPVFDVWLTACANPVRAESTKRGPAAPDQPSEPLTRQRPRR